MVYTQQTWADGKAGATPVNAARLTHIEQGIAAAYADFPVAVLRQNAAQTGIAASTWASITMNVADIDTHSGWSSSNPTRWTVPANQAGIYALGGHVTITGSAVNQEIAATYKKNGNLPVPVWEAWPMVGASGINACLLGRRIVSLAVGDYVEIAAFYPGGTWGTYVDSTNGPTFTIERIR